MYSRFIFLVLSLLIFSLNIANARTIATPSSYIVSNIEATSLLKNRAEAERDLFLLIKEKAFSFVKLYLNRIDLDTKNIDIDSLLVEFHPIQIIHTNEGYKGFFEVVFDRSAIDSLLMISKIVDDEDNKGIKFRVFLQDGPVSWLNVKKCLLLNNIDYRLTLLSNSFVEGNILNISIDKLTKVMLQKKFEVIENNFIYFIRPITIE